MEKKDVETVEVEANMMVSNQLIPSWILSYLF